MRDSLREVDPADRSVSRHTKRIMRGTMRGTMEKPTTEVDETALLDIDFNITRHIL